MGQPFNILLAGGPVIALSNSGSLTIELFCGQAAGPIALSVAASNGVTGSFSPSSLTRFGGSSLLTLTGPGSSFNNSQFTVTATASDGATATTSGGVLATGSSGLCQPNTSSHSPNVVYSIFTDGRDRSYGGTPVPVHAQLTAPASYPIEIDLADPQGGVYQPIVIPAGRTRGQTEWLPIGSGVHTLTPQGITIGAEPNLVVIVDPPAISLQVI